MDKSRIRDRQKDAKELNRYPLFFGLVIGPKGVVNGGIACSDVNADQVIKIAIWQTFDIQIDWRAIEYLILEGRRRKFFSRMASARNE